MKAREEHKSQLISAFAKIAVSTSHGEIFFLDKNGQVHMDPCYLIGEVAVRKRITYLVLEQIDLGKIQNIAEFMFYGTSLGSIIALEINIPVYHFDSIDEKKVVVIKPNRKGNNFALLMGFTSTKEQINNAIKKIEEQDGNVVKVISLIDEENGAEEFVRNKGIEFVAILTLKKIINATIGQIIMTKMRIINLENILEKELASNKEP